MRHADENIIIQFVKSMESFASGAALLSQNELQLIANSVRLLQIAEERRLHLYCASSFPTLPISTVRNLMILLNERQKRAINACDDKSAKKISNLRERNVSFYRASNALVSFIQSAAILECSDNIIARPNICIQLYETFTALVSHFQLYRLEVLRDDSNIEDINNSKSLNGTDVTSASGKNKEGSKKRCQDLINKPMEFCKNIEGFVVQVKYYLVKFNANIVVTITIILLG